MPGLGRRVEFDARSRNYPVRALLGGKRPRSYTWACDVRLDQGEHPACVGFSWAHELAARPAVVPATEEDGLRLYREAQKLDEWEGENYDGTSVLAGAKAVMASGLLEEYRWAFSLDDLILAVGYQGPAIIGINWYEGMFTPAACGHVHPTGRIVGGHAVMLNGVDVQGRRFLLHNSWGSAWGDNGSAWLAFGDAERLLSEQGEAVVPVVRKRNP